MNDLAKEGLRTLMFAYKEFPDNSEEQHLKDCNEKELEDQLQLLGITALEDLLQENCE